MKSGRPFPFSGYYGHRHQAGPRREDIMEPRYKRVLIKVSGEALAGKKGTGLDDEILGQVAQEVKKVHDMGVQIGIVVGGGNFWRGRSSKSMDRATADYMGMLATVMNALALQDAFKQAGIPVIVQTAIEMREISEPYTRNRAVSQIEKNKVVIFGAGIGSPFFSTDTAAALRAVEIDADIILLAKKVDAVYDSDPAENPDAFRYTELTHQEVLEKNLKVMDSTAASLCRDNGIKIHVFGVSDTDNISKAVCGENIGTIIL